MIAPTRVFDYDAFIVHADADKPFVQGYLLRELGLDPERVLARKSALEGARGLAPGRLIIEEIERGVSASRVTIVVLSAAYMTDHWAVFGEQLAAYAHLSGERCGALLPLLREDCDLPPHIRALVKLDFRDSEHEAWKSEATRLRVILDRASPAEPDLPCPYPGMCSFSEGDAARFFGRKAELEEIVGRLRFGERELYVIGASGSGKSSLVTAGLIPRLIKGVSGLPPFIVRTLRPGERPLTRLTHALEAERGVPMAPGAAGAGSALDTLLDHHSPGSSLLLVIDQLEELFAVAAATERAAFLEALRALRADQRCVLVFTLRADFFGAFMESTLWRDLDGRPSRVELGPLDGDSLRAVIEQPARDLSVYFEPALVERLLADTAAEPGALPLLQVALEQLWGKRRRRLLALADYQALGDGTRSGLALALAKRADATLRQLSRGQEAIALRILLRLVNFGEGRADTRRQQARGALRSEGDQADFDAVLQRLAGDRLVTVTGGDDLEDVRVDLAHEVLIVAWPAFAGWITTWRMHEQRRRELEAAAAAWRVRGSGDGGLLDAVEHAAAVAWRAEAGRELGLSADIAAFIVASEALHARVRQQQRRRVRRAFAGVAVFAMVTTVLATTASWQRGVAIRSARAEKAARQVADDERNASRGLLAQSYQETGRQQLLEAQRPLQALPYLVAARQARPGEPGASLRLLFGQASQNLPIVTLAHTDVVESAAFSPDGSRVVTASDDHTGRVWDAATGKPVTSALAHADWVVSAAFSPDGSRVVTASRDHTARVWDAVTGKMVTSALAHADWVVSAVFSSGGSRVVTASRDHTARVWDAVTGMPVTPGLAHAGNVVSAAFSPDGSRVVTASDDHTARVWDAATGKPVTPGLAHTSAVGSAAFSPDGSRVVTASLDHTARVWDAATGKPATPGLVHAGNVVSAAFSPDGSRVVTASWDHTARVWDAATGKPVTPVLAHAGAVGSAVFSSDGLRVVTASRDYMARVWSAATAKPVTPVLVHADSVMSAAFSPDGSRVVTASLDHTARVWDAVTGKPVTPAMAHAGNVMSAAFSPDGPRVVTASWDETARVWDAATGKPVTPPLAHAGSVESAVFSPNGSWVVTASWDHTARVWDAVTGKPVTPALAHAGNVMRAAFSPDGSRVVTASDDHTARVWDAATGKPVTPALAHAGAVGSVAFNSDGSRIVTASDDRTARVWDAATGEPVTAALAHEGVVENATFNRDGSRVVTASDDHTAQVWDAATGKPVTLALVHSDAVLCAAFSPDGSWVVTASGDHTVRVWDAVTGKPLTPALAHEGVVQNAAFSPDGSRVVTASGDHTARVWDLPLAPGTLADWTTITERTSPYVLENGVLVMRAPRAAESHGGPPNVQAGQAARLER